LTERLLDDVEKEIMQKVEESIKEMRNEYAKMIEDEKALLKKKMEENLEDAVSYVVDEVFKL